MSTQFRPIVASNHVANPYTLRQLDKHGVVLKEAQVVAGSYATAVRELKNVVDGAERIEVYNHEGKVAGEVSVEYWRRKRGRL